MKVRSFGAIIGVLTSALFIYVALSHRMERLGSGMKSRDYYLGAPFLYGTDQHDVVGESLKEVVKSWPAFYADIAVALSAGIFCGWLAARIYGREDKQRASASPNWMHRKFYP